MTLTPQETPQRYIISAPSEADSAALAAYIKETYATARHLITKPQEYHASAKLQREWIRMRLSNPLTTCLILRRESASKPTDPVLGMLDSWTDNRARVAHVTTFGMSLHPSIQGRGLGKALLGKFIQWISVHPVIEKIELHVHADNSKALALYEKMGFEREGCRQGAIRYEDGRIIDDIIMALWPKAAQPNTEAAQPK